MLQAPAGRKVYVRTCPGTEATGALVQLEELVTGVKQVRYVTCRLAVKLWALL